MQKQDLQLLFGSLNNRKEVFWKFSNLELYHIWLLFLPEATTYKLNSYEKIKLDIIRQERFNGCGNDFIGRDMRVIYRLTNNTKNPIYVFGFAYEQGFLPTGYKLRFNEDTHQWDYPTRNNQPVPWRAVSSLEKSVKKIEAGEFIEFDACHNTAEKGMKFA